MFCNTLRFITQITNVCHLALFTLPTVPCIEDIPRNGYMHGSAKAEKEIKLGKKDSAQQCLEACIERYAYY